MTLASPCKRPNSAPGVLLARVSRRVDDVVPHLQLKDQVTFEDDLLGR